MALRHPNRPDVAATVFAGGVQVFHFLEGRWHLSDITEKYHEFHQAAAEHDLLTEEIGFGLFFEGGFQRPGFGTPETFSLSQR